MHYKKHPSIQTLSWWKLYSGCLNSQIEAFCDLDFFIGLDFDSKSLGVNTVCSSNKSYFLSAASGCRAPEIFSFCDGSAREKTLRHKNHFALWDRCYDFKNIFAE
jgi:hypothetical protein